MEDQSKLEGQQLVQWMFLTRNPRIASFPHILVKCGEETLRAVSIATDTAIGLWGERPMFTADGKHYLEPESGKIEDDFSLWKLSSNQKYLYQRAQVAPDPSFRMFIPADTPVAALRRTYEHFRGDDQDVPWFGDYINYVCDWLADLHWALIPLEGERCWSIFAAAPSNTAIVEKVSAEVRRSDIPTAHLFTKDQLVVWYDDAVK